MDTRWWGGSAWQLFHLVAFRSKHPQKLLNMMKDILPCKFCRESTTKFVHNNPLHGDPGKWLYEIHNMVNDKLRKQSQDDESVINPGVNPSYEEVREHYSKLKLTAVPGRDFLFAISKNYSDESSADDMHLQRAFLHELAEQYPYARLRSTFKHHLKVNPPDLVDKSSYMHWMYELLSELSDRIHVKMPTYAGYAHRASYYKSGCERKSYHGKTCRRMKGGGYKKDRDHRRTYKISHNELLKL